MQKSKQKSKFIYEVSYWTVHNVFNLDYQNRQPKSLSISVFNRKLIVFKPLFKYCYGLRLHVLPCYYRTIRYPLHFQCTRISVLNLCPSIDLPPGTSAEIYLHCCIQNGQPKKKTCTRFSGGSRNVSAPVPLIH